MLEIYLDPQVAEILIRNGANVNAVDIDGETPVSMAARNGMDFCMTS